MLLKKLIKKIFYFFGLNISKADSAKNIDDWLFDYNFDILIDVGASDGKYSIDFLKKNKNMFVYAFEPIPSSFNQLKKKLSSYKNIFLFNCALSNKRGTSSFYLNTHITSSSLLEMKDLHKKAFPKSYGEKKISVKLNTINNLIHRKFLLNNLFFFKNRCSRI